MFSGSLLIFSVKKKNGFNESWNSKNEIPISFFAGLSDTKCFALESAYLEYHDCPGLSTAFLEFL